MVPSLLSTGPLAVRLAGCSKREESSHTGKPQIGQTNAVALPSLLSTEDLSESSIADLKEKADEASRPAMANPWPDRGDGPRKASVELCNRSFPLLFARVQ